MTAQAQWGQVLWNITARDAEGVDFEVLLRNTQPYMRGQVFDIYAVEIDIGYSSCDDECEAQVGGQTREARTVGPVDRRDYVQHPSGLTFYSEFFRWQFSAQDGIGNVYGPSSDDPRFPVDFGLLGCSRPFLTVEGVPNVFAGRTCLSDGYDGWISLAGRVSFSPEYDGSEFTAQSMDVRLLSRTLEIPTYSTPEPSTYVLMAAGLLALGATARPRDRRPHD